MVSSMHSISGCLAKKIEQTCSVVVVSVPTKDVLPRGEEAGSRVNGKTGRNVLISDDVKTKAPHTNSVSKTAMFEMSAS